MLHRPALFCWLGALVASTALAEDTAAPRLEAPADWAAERIELPPGFAPDMKWRGTEDLRFAPGMFRPESDSFLSYVFVFRLPETPSLDQPTLERELLAYYRGLATAVLKGGDAPVDAAAFTLKLRETPAGEAAASRTDLKQYAGRLTWVEPFVTRKPQMLNLELQTWKDREQNCGYLFACVSPQATDAAIWKTLRSLRARYAGR